MSTLQQLKTYAADVLHVPYALTPDLSALAADVDAGRTSFAAAALQVERGAIQTTGVAELSYQFFTGATLRSSGLDYLLSPTGPNPNNLNSVYYQNFNIENRYINFAVNLGKNGEGAASFTSAYGALSLSDTVVKAYTTIFGFAPDAAKTSALLNDMVPDGRGGTYTRAQYFASYGLDGANGVGTKAALVGWLLAQAAKEDVGVYAQAYDAFIADLAPDGLAKFNVDLLAAYGPASASPLGATISFSPSQSVSTTSADPALRSTDGGDTITGTAGLNAGASIATGNGNDTLTIPGVVTGSVTLGNGNDTVTLGALGSTASATPVLGAPPTQYGSVTLGSGVDTVYLTGGTAAGTTLSASGTANVLHLGAPGATTFAGTIKGFQTVYLDGVGAVAGLPTAGVQTIYDDIPYSPSSPTGGMDFLPEIAGQIVVMQATSDSLRLSGQDPSRVTLFLDGYRGAPTTQIVFPSFGAGVSANGGSLVASLPAPNLRVAAGATFDLHVVSDSTAGLIAGYGSSSGGTTYAVQLPNLVISGSGALTAQIGVVAPGGGPDTYSFQTIDATAAGDLNIAFTVSYQLSGSSPVNPVFKLSDGTDNITVSYASASSSSQTLAQVFVCGAGRDTFTVAGNFQTVGGAGLANLYVTSAQTVATPSEIDGFKKGVDHLVLDAVTPTLTPGVQAFVGAAATLTQALINVSSHVAANTGAVFEFAGDTYVYQQDATVGVNTGDGLIRLVGVTGLTLASGSAAGDIHVHG